MIKNDKKWFELADYFDADEFFGVMADYIADTDANWLGAISAMNAIAALCPEKFGNLEAVMSGVEDNKVIQAYEKIQDKLANKKILTINAWLQDASASTRLLASEILFLYNIKKLWK